MLGGALARSLVGIGKAAFLRRCLAALGVGAAQAKRDRRAPGVGRQIITAKVVIINIGPMVQQCGWTTDLRTHPASSTATTPARVYRSEYEISGNLDWAQQKNEKKHKNSEISVGDKLQ